MLLRLIEYLQKSNGFHQKKSVAWKQFFLGMNIAFIFLFFHNISISQVTIKKITPRLDTAISRPPIYDSLQNFSSQENFINYQKYIGLQLYLPPFSNPAEDGFTFRRVILFSEKVNSFTIPGENRIVTSHIYKPYPKPYSLGRNNSRLFCSDQDSITDSYYTIVDVLDPESELGTRIQTQISDELKSLMWSSDLGFREPILMLKNELHDTLYYGGITTFNNDYDISGYSNHLDPFILVSYFTKMKELNEGKKFILFNKGCCMIDLYSKKQVCPPDETIWRCKEVTLVKKNDLADLYLCEIDSFYCIVHILESETGETVVTSLLDRGEYKRKNGYVVSKKYEIGEPSYLLFWSYEKYLQEQKEKNETKENLLAKKRKEDLVMRQTIEEKEKLIIQKYGQEFGSLINEGKVGIGMSKEMCEASWGKPYDKFVTVTKTSTLENWYYSWKKSLTFKDGLLERVEF